MKYVDEFRDRKLILAVANKIQDVMPRNKINIMEVCGTHTMSFFRFGLNKLLPENLRLIAGPGCPVCVSHQAYIDQAIDLAKDKNNIILTFGDMLRVPGKNSTLEKERARGAGIQVVYSPLDSLIVAKDNPKRKVVFLAVGFETTAPTIAASILQAKKDKLKNLSFFSSLKLIPPAMDFLLQDDRLNLQAFLCPGHVSAIIGTKAYEAIASKFAIACCVAGFEPLDILEGLYILVKQVVGHKPKVANQYARVVKREGNLKAQAIMGEFFRVYDAQWRGLGRIPQSGLSIKDKFSNFDAEKIFSIRYPLSAISYTSKKCKCGDVLKGLISPVACPLFSKVCLPDNPIGPCMVSSEGACNAYYRYR